jgi:cardiolipin synthase A/B
MTELWLALQPHLRLWLGLAWGAYLVWLAGWIVLQKREPVATLSWIMSLALLPVLGLLVYHLLGPTRIRRQRIRRHRARSLVDELHFGARLAGHGGALGRLAQATSGFPPSSAERVQLLVDGARTFDAIVEAIESARYHVHLEYYIFDPDRTGTRIRDALAARARAGVSVRLLVDAIGSARLSNAFLAPLRAAGAQVVFFHRFRLRRLWRPRLNLRSHRKLVVVDGRIGFTGGINISDTENETVRDDAFHDLHLRLEGEAVRWLQLAFAEDWGYACGIAPKGAEQWPDFALGPVRTQVLPAGPDTPWEPIHRVMVSALHGARERIWLATPYFVPGEAARMALTSAALRGVDVRLLVPLRSDSALVSAAARSYFDELIAAGVRVYEYPSMLHSKALLVDADTCVLGSSNFDNRSFRLNFELSVLIEDAGVAAALEGVLARDLERAIRVPAERRPGIVAALAEATARLLSPLL